MTFIRAVGVFARSVSPNGGDWTHAYTVDDELNVAVVLPGEGN